MKSGHSGDTEVWVEIPVRVYYSYHPPTGDGYHEPRHPECVHINDIQLPADPKEWIITHCGDQIQTAADEECEIYHGHLEVARENHTDFMKEVRKGGDAGG